MDVILGMASGDDTAPHPAERMVVVVRNESRAEIGEQNMRHR